VNDCDNVHLCGKVARKRWQYGGYAWQLTVCAAVFNPEPENEST